MYGLSNSAINSMKFRIAYELSVELGYFKKGEGMYFDSKGKEIKWFQRPDLLALFDHPTLLERLDKLALYESEKQGIHLIG